MLLQFQQTLDGSILSYSLKTSKTLSWMCAMVNGGLSLNFRTLDVETWNAEQAWLLFVCKKCVR